jgi:Spy/CpxP family protein refolding chaperone
MQLRTILAALTAVTLSTASFSALAQTASSRPPTPKPAAGALPQTTPLEVGQSGRSRQPN